MKIKHVAGAALLAIAGGGPLSLPAQELPPPAKPKVHISSLLIRMLVAEKLADRQDPIDINGCDIDFGNSADGENVDEKISEVLDELLQGK
jgi:hypothetical protein